MNSQQQPIAMQVRAVMILLGAFASGVFMFAGVAFALGPLWQEMDAEMQSTAQLLTLVAAGAALGALGPAFVFRTSMLKRMASQETPQHRFATYRGMAIIVGAMGEGAALFCCVVLLLTGTVWVAALGLATFVVCLGLVFPTTERVQTHVHQQSKDKYA